MPPRPHRFARLDALERRYDGPIPPADPAILAPSAAGRARMFGRLAADATRAAARRRRHLAASAACGDARLAALSRDLGLYRAQSVAWSGGE